jgi:plastocyanin
MPTARPASRPATTASAILRFAAVSIILLTAISRSSFAHAQTILEGTVHLPPPAPAKPPVARYQGNIVGTVAAPDPLKAAVYLEGKFPASTPPPPTIVLRQSHYQFVPGLLVIQTGTSVEFPNEDDSYHNVFSYSRVKRFDLGRYRRDEKPARQLFDKAGVVKLYCEIHEHMHGTILVVDSPYFTKTDEHGNYLLDLRDLPAGRYELKAWIDEKVVFSKGIDVIAGKKQRVDLGEP